MANKPNNPSLWSKAKSLAKQKFDVYPSAYANGWAAKWYKSKGGTWRKAQYGMEVSPEDMFSETLLRMNREANIPVVDDAGTFNEQGVWVPDWETIRKQAQRYGSKLVRTKKGSLIKFDDQWNVVSANDNPEMARGGEPQNSGFQALPEYVQNKIMSNMAYGGYIPQMAAGGWAQQAAIAIAMKKAGKKPKFMQDGGEPDGAMALGQIDAAMDKLAKLRQFIQPESDLEPWVSSKLTLMDHYTDAVSDYMMYNPEAQEEMMEPMEEEGDMEEMRDGGIPQRYKNMGFSKVGVKKQSTRPGKKWMVLAKKGDQYKVVHGGWKGMKDFTQHGSEKRRDRFWDRMGGRNSAKATDPFSPLYWHKRFGTWQEGGEIYMPEMKSGGSTWSGNAWYNMGGYVPEFGMGGMPCYECGGMYAEGGEQEMNPEPNPGYKYGKRSKVGSILGKLGIKPVSQWTGNNDGILENLGEVFLPGPARALLLTDDVVGAFKDKRHPRSQFAKFANVASMMAPLGGVSRLFKAGMALPKAAKYANTVISLGDALKGLNTLSHTAFGDVASPWERYKNGGGIHINPANKGKFTASANRAGMGVQEFARHVLANKEDYSSTQVKRANFARNAAKWKKQEGGPVEGDVLDVTPEQLEYLRRMGYQFEMI